MGALADEAKRRNPYLALEAGESIEVAYKGFKLIPSTYDPTKENFRFMLETEHGLKFWDTSSNRVAMILDTVPEGGKVKITKKVEILKSGEKKTTWDVEPIIEDKIVDDEKSVAKTK